ncbi:MAG: hypothetical protein PHN57_07845 [Candidatus Omnitrophica bacterium]|nr:hypothetical protein [Candidatus Omnitrophota bacterium]
MQNIVDKPQVKVNEKPLENTVPAAAVPSTPPEPEVAEIKFWIYARDKERLNDFVEMAYLLKLIPKKELQDYMIFCLGCGAGAIKQKLGR